MKTLLVSVAFVTMFMGGQYLALEISNRNKQFEPQKVAQDTYIVTKEQNLMVRYKDAVAISYKNCTTISNEVIVAEVNGKNALAIVQKDKEDGSGIIMVESHNKLSTFKAAIPCMDTSIMSINLNLKWD